MVVGAGLFLAIAAVSVFSRSTRKWLRAAAFLWAAAVVVLIVLSPLLATYLGHP
jgi:fluoride ion exporter CrcB/FEX